MLTTGLLELFSFIDREISSLVFLSDVFLKSLLIVLLLKYVTGSIKNLAPTARHLMWLSGFLCLVLVPFLPALFKSLFSGTALGSSMKVMTLTLPAATGGAQFSNITQGIDWPLVFFLVYFVILSFLLLRLLASISRVARIGNSSEYLHAGESVELLNSLRAQMSISRKVRLGLSESIHSPHSSGLITPKILLPLAALDWDRSTLESVLIHELSHIERFDWLTTIICYVFASINWFNPLVWYALKKLKGEAEYSCDSAVLETGKSHIALAEDLLKVARASMSYHRLELSAQSMIDEEIPSRIENILQECTADRKLGSSFFLVLLLFTSTILTASGSTSVIAVRTSDVIERSQLLYSEQPIYPMSAIEKNIPGWVLLSFTVDAYGKVESESIAIEFSQPEGVFDAASINALKKFKFEARKVNYQAMPSLGLRYMFRYRQPRNLSLATAQ